MFSRKLRVNLLQVRNVWFMLLATLFLSACNTTFLPQPTATPFIPPTNTPQPSPTPTITPTPEPQYPWTDEIAVMGGICFESAADAVGRAYVIRSVDELIRFYNLADNSNLCRMPVERHEFDFEGGRVLAGTWSAGTGCTARHEVESIQQNDDEKTLTIFLKLVTEGACSYELVRPFWIGLDNVSDYTIELVARPHP